jgi:hypothetical protein
LPLNVWGVFAVFELGLAASRIVEACAHLKARVRKIVDDVTREKCGSSRSSRLMARLVMQRKQLIGAEGQNSGGPAVIIAEFHLVNTLGESFDDRAHLATQKAMVSDVFQQCNHR